MEKLAMVYARAGYSVEGSMDNKFNNIAHARGEMHEIVEVDWLLREPTSER